MRRWWPILALLLSLGINVGLVTALVIDRSRARDDAGLEAPPNPDALPPGQGGPGQLAPGPRFKLAAERLGLAPEARERFLALEQRHFAEARAARLRVQEAREAIRRALLAAELDETEIERLTAAANAAVAEQDRGFVRHLVELKGILEPAQFERYLAFLTRARAAGAAMDRRPPNPRPRLRDRLRQRP